MGDTKESLLHHGLKLVRLISLIVFCAFSALAGIQVLFFQEISITFQSGTDAQQFNSIKIKKGTSIDLPTPLKPGSYFMGWSLSPTSAEILEDSGELLYNTTLYAVWDGAEKYAVLSVNNMPYKEVNIFDTSVDGLTPTQLNQEWRVLDDYAQDNPNLTEIEVGSKKVKVDLNNNFSRFLGWQYLNMYGSNNDLLFEVDKTGKSGKWTLVERDANGREISRTVISETHKFYPPNYRTTFTALFEYRELYVQLYDQDENIPYDSFPAVQGERLPVFNQSSARFSHWEIGDNGNYNFDLVDEEQSDLIEKLNQVKRRYEAGEALDVSDPLMYYFTSRLTVSLDDGLSLVAVLPVRAVYWDNNTVPQFSIRSFSDKDSGNEYVDFYDVDFANLSIDSPVSYELANNCIWLFLDEKINSYSFYDHKGVFHEFNMVNLIKKANGSRVIGIGLDVETTILEQQVYFKSEWAITITVYYQTATVDVNVNFNYGSNLYVLPSYRYITNESITSYIRKIGDTFVMLSGENYMKTDYIFVGWHMVGDDSNRVYLSGEMFTVPNLKNSGQNAVIEFEAVWHLQRMLFDFDFDGGAWENEQEPDFTLMKGAYGDRVQIIEEIPVKFGYDFVGWKLEGDTELLQPGTYINVGTKIQTLQAQWKSRRLRVEFWYLTQNGLSQLSTGIVTDSRTGNQLCSGGYVELPFAPNSNLYIFNGWQVGDLIFDSKNDLRLTTQVLALLDTKNTKDSNGSIIDVKIYANQTRRTVDVEYNFDIEISNGYVTVKVDSDRLQYVLGQGELFYNYYPFSVGDYSVFDAGGRSFAGWSYSLDGGKNLIQINADTLVPVVSGINHITIYGGLNTQKSVTVVYYDFSGKEYEIDSRTYYYYDEINLIKNTSQKLPASHDKWGIFTGWGLEQDSVAGSPEIIFDVHYNDNPVLKLANELDTSTAPYLIDVDRYAVKVDESNYILKLYAIYSNDYVKVTYNYLNSGNNIELTLPIYSNRDYTQSVIGGSTVGYDSVDFLDYGLTVLDDRTLNDVANKNFIGWQIELPDNVDAKMKERFENKIWFPGEALPAFNFDVEFSPVRIECDNQTIQEYQIGNRTYRVLSLSKNNIQSKINVTGSIDIVVLPIGNYTIKQGNIVINSDREVHVIVPASGNIVLEPRAIQCNTIKEFYIPDNLTITGSPVVGENFQTYLVKKGYRLKNQDGTPTDVTDASIKYSYEACMSGLLLSVDNKILYSVPSHSNFTTESLLNVLQSYSVNSIKEYALADINNLTTINLGINVSTGLSLSIEANAIYNVSAKHIILPTSVDTSDLVINPQIIAGKLSNLNYVTFGDATTVRSWYAFVEQGFVYYVDDTKFPNAKTHVMYVLPAAELKPLDFTLRNLRFESSVNKIEPTALMGRDWTQINSIMVENSEVDLTVLLGIPNNIPLFTTADNPHKAPMIQPYVKTFIFTCADSSSGYTRQEISFKYGETFVVFNAQKNDYNFYFDKTWSQFVGWKLNGSGRIFNIGEVYKVGLSEEIIGDNYTVVFDAYSSECWTNYPVQFYVYNKNTGKNEAYTPEAFYDVDGVSYRIDELLTYYDDLDQIYLPTVSSSKLNFTTVAGVTYQFIGWSIKDVKLNNINLWNNVDLKDRILPNKTMNAVLNSGNGYQDGNINIYRYYALYEEVTPNLEYELLSNQTFAVTRLSNYGNNTIKSLNIPFAKYDETSDCMLPISKIGDNAFNNISLSLSKIAIGGAVSDIGDYAFYGVKAVQIDFAQRGRVIYYNYRQNTAVQQLTIGEYAFANNSEIKNLVLPASLETLNDCVFKACVNLVKVTMEDGETPALRNIGNEVFSENRNMTDNAIISLLTEDGKNGDNRFVTVGAGIFMNTNIRNLKNSDGVVTNKIVWRDTLLYVYYPNGYDTHMKFNEKEIAGYAFINAYSTTDESVKISLEFTNVNVKIHANAFTNLPTSITQIDMSKVNVKNVDLQAFDTTVKHTVNVKTSNKQEWDKKFETLLSNGSNYFRFN